MPGSFLTANWRYLLMLNYPVDESVLADLVPRGTTLDRWQGSPYVSIVGFMFLNTRLLGLPVPLHRHFPELNLRFYVVRREGDEIRRGVVFVKEFVPKWAVAAVARWVYNENYVATTMDSTISLPVGERPGRFEYRWQVSGRWNSVDAVVTGQPQPLVKGTESEFISEHYWGYARHRDGGATEYRVEHPPWQVWQARQTHIDLDASTCYGSRFADCLSAQPTSAFVADGSAVTVYRGQPLTIHPG